MPKLVRDRIPEIIRAEGRACSTRTLTESEYRAALLHKLVEEATEARDAPPAELVNELADVLEVLDALTAAFGLTRADIEAEQARKREERGGFAGRLWWEPERT